MHLLKQEGYHGDTFVMSINVVWTYQVPYKTADISGTAFFNYISLHRNFYVLFIQNSWKFVPECPINSKSTLAQVIFFFFAKEVINHYPNECWHSPMINRDNNFWSHGHFAHVAIPPFQYFTTCNKQFLTHWGRDKMATIFQTTFSNAFSWKKMHVFRLGFHWSLFLGVQLTMFNHWVR